MALWKDKAAEKTAEAPDPARAAIEGRMKEENERAGFREETSAERNARFAGEVRARMATPDTKTGVDTKRVLVQGRMQLAASQRNTWDVIPEYGTTLDNLLDPAYWAHIGARLRQWDHVEVRAEDGSYYAELIVEDCGRLYAKMAVLLYKELQVADPEGSTIPNGYAVKWRGPHSKWVALRGDDELRKNFSSQAEAQRWLQDHLRVVAA